MITDDGRIEHERHYPHPVERVWAALVDSDALARWLMPNDFVPTVGARFTFEAGPPRGTIDGQVVAVEPPHRMVWQWMLDGAATTVTITLRAVEGGTLLRLEHADVPDDPRPRFDGGWVEKFDALERVLKGEA